MPDKTEPTEPSRRVRLRTASTDKKKALDHYQTLRRSGRVKDAVVIAEDHDGSITVLGQMLTPDQVGQLLLIAAHSLVAIDKARHLPKLEPHQEPERRGEHNGSKPRAKEIVTDADGILQPPPGENIISCGECNHPRWHVLHYTATDQHSRIACAHCGNEVKNIEIFHAEGHA
jgi:hypothetical protein